MRQVVSCTAHFSRLGAVYAVGEALNGRRWVRPATPANPVPDLKSCEFPPTLVDAAEAEAAFGLPASVRPHRCGEQLELFA